MREAKKLGLTSAGYAFLTYELLLDSCLPENITPETSESCSAIDGILDISLFVPQSESYSNFSKLVRRKMEDEPFNRVMPSSEVVAS